MNNCGWFKPGSKSAIDSWHCILGWNDVKVRLEIGRGSSMGISGTSI